MIKKLLKVVNNAKKNTKISKNKSQEILSKEYIQTLMKLKKQIREAQVKAAFAVNKELIKLYWLVGKIIAERQNVSGWGSGVIEKLANDLQGEFPGMAGFSKLNVFRMRAFFWLMEKCHKL